MDYDDPVTASRGAADVVQAVEPFQQVSGAGITLDGPYGVLRESGVFVDGIGTTCLKATANGLYCNQLRSIPRMHFPTTAEINVRRWVQENLTFHPQHQKDFCTTK